MIRWALTAFLVRWLNIVAITNQSSYSGTHTVTIGLFRLFIQENVWHKTGVALVHNVLKQAKSEENEANCTGRTEAEIVIFYIINIYLLY